MFVSYDCEAFGLRLKALRKGCGLSQNEVSIRTGMNTDTLRRIENGSVIPRYESLEVLSNLYQVNLLQVLDQCKVSNQLLRYYDALDNILLKSDADALQQLIEAFRKDASKARLKQHIHPQELEQFNLLLINLQKSFSSNPEDKATAKAGLWLILQDKYPRLSVETLESYAFTDFEAKVLLMVAVLSAELQERSLSTTMLTYLKDHKKPQETARHTEKKMYLKALINLAYNYHLDDKHQDAYGVAVAGIAECLRYDLLYGLYILYYRKGIAEIHLQLPALESFQNCFQLLKIQGLEHLIEHYRTVLKELYQFSIKPAE